MNKRSSPVILVDEISLPTSLDLTSRQIALAATNPVPLLQIFPGGNLEATPSGHVRVGWSGTSIHLLAELEDHYIFTRATQFNEMIYLLGDCFEVFLRRASEPQYLEFQIAPNNMALQLLYPSYADFARHRRLPEEEFIDRFAVKEPAFASQVWLEPLEQRWTIAASIDLRLLVSGLTTLAHEEWRFNFSRYDYPAAGDGPVLSCTSALRELDFHLQEDWGVLHFKP